MNKLNFWFLFLIFYDETNVIMDDNGLSTFFKGRRGKRSLCLPRDYASFYDNIGTFILSSPRQTS